MVYRVYTEKRPEFATDAASLYSDATSLLGIAALERVRVINRYDVENIDEKQFEIAVRTVFSEPQLDVVSDRVTDAENARVFAVEYLPGQFDMRADSAAQCIQLFAACERPTVRCARVYVLYGALSDKDVALIKKHVINPVESREATLDTFDTLRTDYELPTSVKTVNGFTELTRDGLEKLVSDLGLAMDADDAEFCQKYFRSEHRDPTITEIRMIDTYWSDHCRHTTFLTTIDSVTFDDPVIERAYRRYLDARASVNRTKPQNLMDVATVAVRVLKAEGRFPRLDESDEINACTVKITVNVDGKDEPWLLLFKNETHNHPTEIEPFGGAATCIGGAIRDPLSGRSYVYAAMRVTGAGDPTSPLEDTLAGKLPQRTIVTTAAAGYSSYGNQIGLATGLVNEVYHPGYIAKRMEIGAVIAAAPEKNVRRETPAPGDAVILLGGRTGRDGCGGATGSSKSHTEASLESCGAEVQKGNAPEERKLQRLFRNGEATRLIKRCNDFGAGGVSVAIGELADGLEIDLNAVPRKYDGLDGTELAISESQERMAVVVASADADKFISLATAENLEATVVATVTESPRLVMHWNGAPIVDVSREFLNSNGAEKHIKISVAASEPYERPVPTDFAGGMTALAGDLNVCSGRGLSERFDSTIGAGTVLMPFGGKNQLTPIQTMVHKISLEHGETDDCSFMSYGFDPYVSEKSPYHGAYLAVVNSLAKLIAAGASPDDTYLSFQEYFEKPLRDGKRWGKPLSALLGALEAQLDYGVGAIGGKDSMSGSFEHIDVPPTLVSFAVTTGKTGQVISPEFKDAGHRVVLLSPDYNDKNLPDPASQKAVFKKVYELACKGKVLAAYTPCFGGVAEAVMKMCFGNSVGFAYEDLPLETVFGLRYGSFVLELADDTEAGTLLGVTTADPAITYGGERVTLSDLLSTYEGKLEKVYPCNIKQSGGAIPAVTCRVNKWQSPRTGSSKPRVLIPVFPGTNCEYDTARALEAAGAEPEIFVINNLTPAGVSESVSAFAKRLRASQIVFVPGGFSGGDEPEGSGKFITAFFRNGAVSDAVSDLLENRDGLMCGVCNGFQALIKLGLVPYGRITATDEKSPTLTFNRIGRHQSRLVRTRIASNKSPWLMLCDPETVYTVPISHGEGRFIANDAVLEKLIANGQIATQYVDLSGAPTSDIRFNPNDSALAVEGITSPDGRVLGKMGHSERKGKGLYRNVDGEYDMKLFESAVKYFKI